MRGHRMCVGGGGGGLKEGKWVGMCKRGSEEREEVKEGRWVSGS